jgi:GTPase SAR1 family protein
LWDFAGQEQFSYLWNNFIKGSDAVLLITDSTLENVEKSKFFLELIKEQAPQAHTSVIGNKQDLDEAMNPEKIEKILGLKTYSMIANDSNNRDKMITIIADVLEMNAEVSPLLKPLLERDTYMEQAAKALENAEFGKAATYFDKISDLCIELGDDSLGKEFYEKSQKIKSMLQKLSTPVEESKVKKPTIPEPQKTEEQEKPKIQIGVPPPPPHGPSKVPEVSKKEINLKKPSIPPALGALKKPKLIEKTEEPEPEKADLKKIEEEKETSEPKALIKPKISQEKVELALNPEDFMVKPRPKTVMVVPKDARNKLKTSPFAQVTNPMESKTPVPVTPTKLIKAKPSAGDTPTKKIDAPIIPKKRDVPPLKVFDIPKEITQPPTPVSPTELIKPKAKVVATTPSKIISTKTPTTTQKTAEPTVQATSTEISMEQRANLENSLMDLKIKKANISKISLDFDMKELTGEITNEELEEKKTKMEAINAGLNKQIKELEQLLKN